MRHVYIVLGFLSLGIGAAGALLPVLPTMPFLLAASFFFSKGSTRFNNWFRSTKLYKNHFESLARDRAMSLRSKITILGFASAMLILGFVFSPSVYGRILILCMIGLKYYYFLFKIKTAKDGQVEGYQQKVPELLEE